ncbi:MAG: competence protein CoiA [Anaerobacillus sp.]|uniref:competence protein CoiA n=1 Tax=Anaerobacillus sp. TaxID=1872506 RepID=UPI00391D6C2C
MLVALTENDNIISLASLRLEKEELLQLRHECTFLCPACRNEVILKLGTKQAWHFAHKSKQSCTDELEGESPYHIEGKKLLFEWLQKQKLDVRLEPYLQDIKQRPDLLVTTTKQTYAIEFQCAKISPQLFNKRTFTYQKNNLIPIWILGGNQLKRQHRNIYRLTSFHWLFSNNYFTKSPPQILSFCPLNKTFINLKNLTAISSNNSITSPSYISLKDLSLQKLFDFDKPFPDIGAWLEAKKLWRKQRLHLSQSQQFLRRLYYEKGQSLWLFPSEAGIPVSFHYFIETPTYIWQSWLLEIFINTKKIGDTFHCTLVRRAFYTLVKKGIFPLRMLPLLENGSYFLAIDGYLKFLCHVGILTTRDQVIYEKTAEIPTQKNLAQAIINDRYLFLRYLRMK